MNAEWSQHNNDILKVYYNSKYIDAEETDLSRNQKVLGRYRLGIVIVFGYVGMVWGGMLNSINHSFWHHGQLCLLWYAVWWKRWKINAEQEFISLQLINKKLIISFLNQF